MENVDILIKHGLIVTVDEAMTVIEDGAVAISGTDILAVGTTADIVSRYQAGETIDASGQVVMPGLICAHTHLAMTLMRGFVEDLALQDFLAKAWPIESKFMTSENVFLGTQLAIAEMIQGGVTTAMDMYFHPSSVLDAAREAGFRVVNGMFINILNVKGEAMGDELIAQERARLQELKDDPLLVPAILAHGTYTISPENLRLSWDLAKELDVIWHIHASENDAEVQTVREIFGVTPIEHLHNLGLLDRRTVLAHVVVPTDEDIELLAASGASVVHCPISNLKTGAGFAPLGKFKDAGVPVALGIDAAATSVDLDMWKEMRFAALIHRGTSKDPTFNPAPDIVRMATIDSARVLGLEDKIGSLESGKRADITLVNMEALHLVPMYNVYTHLVFAVGREDVSTVLVNGRVVMRDRELLTLNEKMLISEARCIEQLIKEDDAARAGKIKNGIIHSTAAM